MQKFVHKEIGFWLFDKFMEATEASVASFATLLNGILKKHEDSDYDELDFQRKVRVRRTVSFISTFLIKKGGTTGVGLGQTSLSGISGRSI